MSGNLKFTQSFLLCLIALFLCMSFVYADDSDEDEKLETAEEYYDRGESYWPNGDKDRAIADFTKAIELNPQWNKPYLSRAGLMAYYKYDYESAIADYTRFIELSDSDEKADGYGGRAGVYAQIGEYDLAIDDYSQAIKLYSKLEDSSAYMYLNLYIFRGRAYYEKQDYDRAIDDFSKVIALKAADAYEHYLHHSTYVERGNAYKRKGDIDRAMADYDYAIEISNQEIAKDPEYKYAYYCRGQAYYYRGDYYLAIDDFNHIQLEGYDLGLCYLEIGEYDRAIAEFTKNITRIIEKAKNDENFKVSGIGYGVYYNRGVAYKNKGEYYLAIEDFNEAIKRRRKYLDAYYARGEAYLKSGNFISAIADYIQAAKIKLEYKTNSIIENFKR